MLRWATMCTLLLTFRSNQEFGSCVIAILRRLNLAVYGSEVVKSKFWSDHVKNSMVVLDAFWPERNPKLHMSHVDSTIFPHALICYASLHDIGHNNEAIYNANPAAQA